MQSERDLIKSVEYWSNLDAHTMKDLFLKAKADWEQKKKSRNEVAFNEYIDDKMRELERSILGIKNSKDDELGDEDEEADMLGFNNFSQISDLRLFIALVSRGVTIDEVLLNCSTNKRISYFIKYQHILTDKEYWTNLMYVYTLHDYEQLPFELYRTLFTSNRKGKNNLMSRKDYKVFKSLPDEMKIYRAMADEEYNGKSFGISWTLNKDIAEFFMNRSLYGEKHKKIKEHLIKRDEVIAYNNERKEKEIIFIKGQY